MDAQNLEFISFKEVQKLLGVSKSTLYKLTSAKEVPHYKPTRGKLYFLKSEIEAWIMLNSKSTTCNE